MTSSRPRQEIAGNPPSRRGHTNQLSISDPSHHVTEAIGTLYGDEDDSGFESGRPLSFISGSQYHEQLHRASLPDLHERPEPQRPATSAPRRRSVTDQPPESPISQTEHGGLRKAHTVVVPPSQRTASPYEQGSKSPASPTSSLRDVQADPSGSQFPLTNIDNPSDISLELSNLKALRRLSMDVGNNIDPDMPPMGLSAMPVVAPSGDDDENDPSRLLWVPARVHPELAPTEFKSFLEKRVQSIRRRSGDSFLSADGNSGFCGQELSLRRHKSMLSRQIDNTGGRGAVGYVDGAERLERQRSSGGQYKPELSLEELVKDPSKAVQRLARESHGASISLEDGGGDDIPILPMAPGAGLRRSTRTTYRKGGSVRSGDRGSLSRRFMRHSDGESPYIGSSCLSDTAKGFISPRVHYEPAADNQPQTAEAESTRRRNNLSADTSHVISGLGSLQGDSVERRSSSHVPADQLSIRTSTSSAATQNMEVASERVDRHESQASQSFPQRSSSQAARTYWDHHPETIEDNATRPGRRPPSNKPKHATQHQYTVKPPISSKNQMMSDTLASPSSLTCADASRTDSLTFIPTLSQPEKKVEKRSKRDKDDDSSGSSSKSGSAWKWLKGVTDDRDRKEESRRAKVRASVEKSQDNARLDVIQTSIDKNAGKGREILVLDRDNVDNKLLEERRKESHRKSNSKKDKDGSIFSSIFGGSRKKEEKEKGHKKSQYLQVPEDVPYKPLTPDVDYHWARFPLLEERAIYRMAHIKLANSRRPLLSQVLLSNFMYSYLAIVQAMHPQMNVPTSPQQKRLEEEARRKRQEEYLARQQIHGNHSDDHGLDQYNFDYHRATVQYAECGSNGQVDYVDDAQIYEDEHGDDRQYDYRYEGMEGFSRDTKDYLDSRGDKDDRRRQGQDDMW